MIIFDMLQGSPDWFKIRRGLPTASNFKKIITAKKGDFAEGADSYAGELIAESLGWQSGFHGSPDTDRGHRLEKEAIRWLRMRFGYKGRDVGFGLSDCGRYGSSVDHLFDDGTPYEGKAPELHTFMKWRVKNELPDDHKAQCHGHMVVTGADRCIFLAYADHPAVENWMIEVKRDAFTDKLHKHIDTFCHRLEKFQREILGEEFEIAITSPEERKAMFKGKEAA